MCFLWLIKICSLKDEALMPFANSKAFVFLCMHRVSFSTLKIQRLANSTKLSTDGVAGSSA